MKKKESKMKDFIQATTGVLTLLIILGAVGMVSTVSVVA
jgi:hypothetical protein